MRKLIFAGVCALGLAACNQPAANQNATSQPNPDDAKPQVTLANLSSPKDYVCQMDLTDDMIADTAHVDGKVYGFCDPGCKAEFLKEPAKYLSQQ